jgi:hypothetical protein
VATQKTLTARAWSIDTVNAFQPICDGNAFGPLLLPLELLNDCYLHEYDNAGQSALVALQRHPTHQGCRVHVQGIVANDGSAPLQLRQVMAAIEYTATAYGADVLTMVTQHKALLAAAPRWGGHISGGVIAKYLKVQ